MFKKFVSFLVLIALSTQIAIATPISQRQPSWVVPGALYDLDFVNNRYWGGNLYLGSGLNANNTAAGFINEANSGANGNSFFAPDTDGFLRTFPQYATRRTNYGVWIEGNYTNFALCSRDMTATTCTGPAWVPTNITPTHGLVSAVLASAGTGYAVNDTITLAGGTFTTAGVIQVLTVSGGNIVTYKILTPGAYTATPTNPMTQGSTSGSGTGATFTASFLGSDKTNRSATQLKATAGNATIFQAVTKNTGASTATPVTPGVSYAVNNTITLNDSCGTHIVLTVNSVSTGGVVTASVTTAGSCATAPANPVAQLSTSGSGTGATFNLTYPTRTYSAYVQRVTGTGVINMTGDGGSHYTAVDGSINSSGYTLVYVNPPAGTTSFSIGFQIVTSGDVISADMNQLEDNSLPSTPMLTTTATLFRGSEESFYMGDNTTTPNNAGQQIIRKMGAGGFPYTVITTYSGNFNTQHLIYGQSVGVFFAGNATPGPMSIGGATTTNSELYGLYNTNKVAFEVDGTGSYICLNNGGVASGATKLATFTEPGHGGFGNNGAGLVPMNGVFQRQTFIPFAVPLGKLCDYTL